MKEKWKICALLIVMSMVCAVSAAFEPEEFGLPAVNESEELDPPAVNDSEEFISPALNKSEEETLCCSGIVIPICVDEGDQRLSDISGNRVVWINEVDDGDEIWIYNTLTHSKSLLFKNPRHKSGIRIDGDYVVWGSTEDQDYWSIFVYYIPTGALFPVITENDRMGGLDIEGSRVVWIDERYGFGSSAVFMYDFLTGIETEVSTNSGHLNYPVISGGKVFWEDVNSLDRIRMCDLTTGVEKVLCPPLLDVQSGPENSGDHVVWTEGKYCEGGAACDVRYLDLSTETSSWLCNRSGNQCALAIDGETVLYEDMGSIGNRESKLYLYDLSTGEEELIYDTNSTATYSHLWDARMDNSKVVWSQVNVTGNHYDLFLYLPFFPF